MDEIQTIVPDTFPALMWAYNVIWAILAIYIVRLGRRLHCAEKRLQSMQRDNGATTAK